MLNRDIHTIFYNAINAVHPSTLLPKNLEVGKKDLVIAGHCIHLAGIDRFMIIAAGKAAAAMCQQAENILGELLSGGICVTKYRHALPLRKITLTEAGHPVPDQHSLEAGEKALQIAKGLSQRDILLLLISGGASSLLADLPPGCTLAELQKCFDLLVNSGATIGEINTIRKHLSRIKGGQLVNAAGGARIFSLIISDVPGDDLQTIGSGLSVGDASSFSDALNILHKYTLTDKIPESILHYIEGGFRGTYPDTPFPNDPVFEQVVNIIIGKAADAVRAAITSAGEKGYHLIEAKENLSGNTEEKAREFMNLLLAYEGPLPACLIWSGETTLRVHTPGKGGRNQHFALSALKALKEKSQAGKKFSVLCAGTDGTDGPTDAGGAFIHSGMLDDPSITAELIEAHLRNFNAYPFFEERDSLLITGPTQTNVMDLVIGIIE
ncbi:MAG: DUF4147 domain-containing protein [Ferruginibacter sp.]